MEVDYAAGSFVVMKCTDYYTDNINITNWIKKYGFNVSKEYAYTKAFTRKNFGHIEIELDSTKTLTFNVILGLKFKFNSSTDLKAYQAKLNNLLKGKDREEAIRLLKKEFDYGFEHQDEYDLYFYNIEKNIFCCLNENNVVTAIHNYPWKLHKDVSEVF